MVVQNYGVRQGNYWDSLRLVRRCPRRGRQYRIDVHSSISTQAAPEAGPTFPGYIRLDEREVVEFIDCDRLIDDGTTFLPIRQCRVLGERQHEHRSGNMQRPSTPGGQSPLGTR